MNYDIKNALQLRGIFYYIANNLKMLMFDKTIIKHF